MLPSVNGEVKRSRDKKTRARKKTVQNVQTDYSLLYHISSLWQYLSCALTTMWHFEVSRISMDNGGVTMKFNFKVVCRSLSSEVARRMEFKCERCNPTHDYKTAKKLSRHENTPSHKRKFDPNCTGVEEVEKAAAKKIRNEKQIAIKAGVKETERKAGAKETERKAGAKETARLAARNQGTANANRDQSKAHQQLAQKKISRAQHKKSTEKDPAPWIIGTGTEEDALKALVRYHGSTNVAMLLHTDDIRMKKNINKFVHVSPEAKAAIRKTWQEGEMAISRAHFHAQLAASGITALMLK